MEIKDGGFKIKSKKLKESISAFRADVCDSGLASAINGDNDVAEAEKLVNEMELLQCLIDGQIKMLSTKIGQKKKTFIIKEN